MPLDAETRDLLKERIDEADFAVALQSKEGKTTQWALANFELAEALDILASEEEDRIAFPYYDKAIEAFENALEVYTAKDHLSEWGNTIVSFARMIRNYALRESGHMSVIRLDRARNLLLSVIENLPHEESDDDRIRLNIELAHIYRAYAEVDNKEKQVQYLRLAIKYYEDAGTISKSKERFDKWVITLMGQATALRDIVQLEEQSSLDNYYRIIDLFKTAVDYYDRETNLPDWTLAHIEYGQALLRIFPLVHREKRRDIAETAANSLHSALKSFPKELLPGLWVHIHIYFAKALSYCAQTGNVDIAPSLMERSINLLKIAAGCYEASHQFAKLAEIYAIIGKELMTLAGLQKGQESRSTRLQAVDFLRKSISPILEKENLPRWIVNLVELGSAFQTIANHEKDSLRSTFYEEAIAVYSQALKQIPAEKEPELIAKIRGWMGMALAELGEADRTDTGIRYLKEAELAFRLALQFYGSHMQSLEFVRLQINLSNLFYTLAQRSDKIEAETYTQHALSTILMAIQQIDKEKMPKDWYIANSNYGLILKDNITRSSSKDIEGDCNKAINAFRNALSIPANKQNPTGHIILQHNLAALLLVLAKTQPANAKLDHINEARKLLDDINNWVQKNNYTEITKDISDLIDEAQTMISTAAPNGFWKSFFPLF